MKSCFSGTTLRRISKMRRNEFMKLVSAGPGGLTLEEDVKDEGEWGVVF